MKDKTLLFICGCLWLLGDIVTTGIGFIIGMKEQNPFLHGLLFHEIVIIKAIGFYLIYLSIESVKNSQRPEYRFISYAIVIIIGSLIVILNTYGIYLKLIS